MSLQAMDNLGRLFDQQECWMIEDLASKLGYAVISVRRLLKRIGYFHSYTHNGKWYTTCQIPAFDAHGIWIHNAIAFSKHGNLFQTIIHLVHQSPAGLSSKELADILHRPCLATLTTLHKNQRLDRIKNSHGFVYLSVQSKQNRRQRQATLAHTSPQTILPLTAETAVCVLVEFIHHPSSSFEDLAEYLGKQKITVSPQAIEVFFQEHHIKKRTIRSLQSSGRSSQSN